MTYQTDSSSRGREARARDRLGPPVVRQGAQERVVRPQPGCRSCPRARKYKTHAVKGQCRQIFPISDFFSSESALPLGLKTVFINLVILLMKIYRSQGQWKI
jgi:hypothetical protein